MTTRSDFTPEEWDILHKTIHEPGVAVMVASPGGVLREVIAVIGGMLEAEDEFAGSELVQSLLQSRGRPSAWRRGRAVRLRIPPDGPA